MPGKSHGWRSLVGCSPRGREESDTTERLHFHFSLSCIGEGHGNPLQCSCLENPRDGGAWWAAVYGVAQSRTRMKPLSSSSSNVVKDLWTSLVVDKNLPASARDTTLIPGSNWFGPVWSRRISHAKKQLAHAAELLKPVPRACLCSTTRCHHSEKPAYFNKE